MKCVLQTCMLAKNTKFLWANYFRVDQSVPRYFKDKVQAIKEYEIDQKEGYCPMANFCIFFLIMYL